MAGKGFRILRLDLRPAMVMRFGVLFTPRLQPGDPQMITTQAAVSTALVNYERKPLKRY
jgi:hypothetical protein